MVGLSSVTVSRMNDARVGDESVCKYPRINHYSSAYNNQTIMVLKLLSFKFTVKKKLTVYLYYYLFYFIIIVVFIIIIVIIIGFSFRLT